MLYFLQSCVNCWTHYFMSWRFRSQKIFAITGVRRSGNHAFIRWLINALEGEHCTLVKLGHGVHRSPSGDTLFFNEMNYRGLMGYYTRTKKHASVIKKAKFVIISTEDYIPKKHDPYVPVQATRITIHRHLLNTISSRLKKSQDRALEGFERGDMKIDHEFMHCIRWLREESEKQSWVKWSYDDWVSSNDYREEFLSNLNLKNNIEPGISKEGDGSSFTGLSRTPNAQEVTRRYTQIAIPERIKALLLEPYYKSLLEPDSLDFLNNEVQDDAYKK